MGWAAPTARLRPPLTPLPEEKMKMGRGITSNDSSRVYHSFNLLTRKIGNESLKETTSSGSCRA